MKGCDQNGTVHIPATGFSVIQADPVIDAYPTAYDRQSDAGAIAVMGSKIVLADICSDVEGSKRMMLPCPFPTAP